MSPAATPPSLHPWLDIAPEVRDALAAGGPVVALESTIISHGMPYPANVATAREVEAIVRAAGAVPATIALIGGRIRVGLGAADLDHLGQAHDVAKASRRDLAVLVVRGATAGTTVAATMLIAAQAGIALFATGGIGGVHRGAESTFDISADLEELGRTPVSVVCAGAKSILDIPKTLEYLETRGVPVIGYCSDAFPAFFARESGSGVDARFDSAAEIAAVIAAQKRLGLSAGLLITNAVPPADALPADSIEGTIRQAVADAEAAGVAGKALTPFLLARINEQTGGESLKANIALIRNNARLAAEIAVSLSSMA
ncbi:pseudouridine-5'-phosphate glycosidase [Pseudoxanthobacter sp.]|uniref:pseudouridine-5'-phosphate glycosidase n=1 Tax=Pseudoxanthobacter sp. TaxID=1925742 RepID=UPI002FE083A0